MQSNPTPAARAGASNVFLSVVFVAILAILGGGGWMVYDKLIKSDGSSTALPATVLPASTIAVATVDADPGLSQKVNLLNFIGKFPSLKSHVTIGVKDDPRKWVVNEMLKSSNCPSVSFNHDFAPWLGEHFALGAVDVGGAEPAPVAALETTNGAAATAALSKVVGCSGAKDFFFKVVGHYVVGSDSQAHLTTIVNAATSAPLSSDAGYKKWTSAVGDPGILNFYVAPQALTTLVKSVGAVPACEREALNKAFSQFSGIAGKLTANSDGLEVIARVGVKSSVKPTDVLARDVAALPSDTAVVLGVAPSGSVGAYTPSTLPTGCQGVGGMPSPAAIMGIIQQHTGLTLPGDLETLLGKAFVMALGGNAPADITQIQGPSQLPFGIEVQGDTAKIQAVLAKVQRKLGVTFAQMGLVQRVANGRFVLATNESYAGAITTSGALGSDPTFKEAVPQASKAQMIMFVRIDSAWRSAILAMLNRVGDPSAASAAANTAGLSAFGLAGWIDDGAVVMDMKLTTK